MSQVLGAFGLLDFTVTVRLGYWISPLRSLWATGFHRYGPFGLLDSPLRSVKRLVTRFCYTVWLHVWLHIWLPFGYTF
jgi:hypothetical protein